jgi:hypothetical protein
MSDDRFDDTIRLLITTSVPAHTPGFWAALHDRLEPAGTGGSDTGGTSGQAYDHSPARKDTIVSLTLPPTHDEERPPAPEELHGFRQGSRRWIPLAVAAGIVGLAVTATAVVGLAPDATKPATPTPTVLATSPPDATPPTPSAAASPSPSNSPGTSVSPYGTAEVTALTVLDPQVALIGFGTGEPLDVPGKPSFAYGWKDRDGDHMLVLSAQRSTDKETGEFDSTLYVTSFRQAENPDGRSTVKVLRTLTEPGTDPCLVGNPDSFVPDMTTLTDTDRDGIGEITVGWEFLCRGELGPSQVRLALLEGADKYILRGTGYVSLFASRETAQEYRTELDPGAEPLAYEPDPDASGWPAGAYAHAEELFKEHVY